jgi:hypothetical protein
MGYEGDAFESVFPNFHDFQGDRLHDEELVKGRSGWSVTPSNYFGFLTGFCLRSFGNNNDSSLFTHVNQQPIELFANDYQLLQHEMFGDAQGAINACEHQLKSGLKDRAQSVLTRLMDFWHQLYFQNISIGGGLSAATQDILFNIAHARAIQSSSLPVSHWYLGGDITYPIVMTKRRNHFATRNAQAFVKKFVAELIPHQNESTLFVFHSFVDGVGKSTMLGNVKNWKRFGADVDKYQITDNTSSQHAEVFEYAKDVYIADLPAQVSHFTYKPNGHVFVDVDTIKGFSEEKSKEIIAYAQERWGELEKLHQKKIGQARARGGITERYAITTDGFFDAYYDNLIILKRDHEAVWLPFVYHNEAYLVNRDDKQLRYCLSLDQAQSSGLKNIYPEQILFTQGVTFPMAYSSFLNDLIGQCRARGVKHVYFVDFLSMYSRSSRENIRVTYLLQQLARLTGAFDLGQTIYGSLTDNADLLGRLSNKQWARSAATMLAHETETRYLLERACESSGLALDNTTSEHTLTFLTQYLAKERKGLSKELTEKIVTHSVERVNDETRRLKAQYGLSKDFCNIYNFSEDACYALSHSIEQVFSKRFSNPELNTIWSLPQEVVYEPEGLLKLKEGPANQLARLESGAPVTIRFVLPKNNRNPLLIGHLSRMLRLQWLEMIWHYFTAYPPKIEGDMWKVDKKTLMRSLPLMIRRGRSGNLYVVQPAAQQGTIPPDPQEVKKWSAKIPWAQKNSDGLWLCYENNWWLADVPPIALLSGNKHFGLQESDPAAFGFPYYQRLINQSFEQAGRTLKNHEATPLSWVYQEMQHQLNTSAYWQSQEKKLLVRARDNFERAQAEGFDLDLGENLSFEERIRPISPEEYAPISLFVRLVATVELVLKDPDASIVLEKSSLNDYYAAVNMLERFVMPHYMGLVAMNPLFRSKEEAQPVIALG